MLKKKQLFNQLPSFRVDEFSEILKTNTDKLLSVNQQCLLT